MRAKVHIEEIRKDREALIVTAIPYQVNKTHADREDRRAGAREARSRASPTSGTRSNREGMRIVIELKRDAVADVVLNQLWRFSDLQTSVRRQHAGDQRRPARAAQSQGHDRGLHGLPRGGGVAGAPSTCSTKARDRAHVLVGLAIAVANIDEVIKLIRQRAEPGGGARAVDGARLAGASDIAPARRADRRPAPQGDRRRHLQAVRGAGARPSSSCALPA